MNTFLDGACDPRQMSPLTLAFLGDAVYELFVRESLVRAANRPANALHGLAVRQVKASAQAQAASKLMPLLDAEELAVYKRGRNAHPGHIPKNASHRDYHAATGVEALVGYLYLQGRLERLRELFRFLQAEGMEPAAQPADSAV